MKPNGSAVANSPRMKRDSETRKRNACQDQRLRVVLDLIQRTNNEHQCSEFQIAF
jgi:hypothetical protein